MPYCAQFPCPVVVARGYCAEHARPAFRALGPEPKRIRGRKLQQLRMQLFKAHPLCVLCEAEGRVTLAVCRDHTRSLSEGGVDTASNEGCQALCQACHDRKSAAEAARGLARMQQT